MYIIYYIKSNKKRNKFGQNVCRQHALNTVEMCNSDYDSGYYFYVRMQYVFLNYYKKIIHAPIIIHR